MKIIFERGKEGLRVLRCFGYDGQAEIPEQIGGEPVTEIGAYAFSETFRGRNAGDMYQSEVLDEAVSSGGGRTRFPAESFGCVERAEKPAASFGCGERAGKPAAGSGCGVDRKAWNGELAGIQCLEDGTPVLSGSRLRSVRLPSGLKEIGRYAFYNCENLNHLTAFGTLRDLGAGLFTGCYGISLLDIYVVQGQKSCLKEILSELRQTLRLNYRDEQGEIRAKLLFPEFFEESVENTPARILMREMHGCGHMYRNAFSGTEFQFLTYDKLFPHVQVQEQPVLVTELVMGRLQYPCQMAETAR
ncbi:MAG: leucine-rich repeat protein, partial [Lachnospiraceae bacterium]|nr:leucine-rich repeat protein [Lachnospiraceae bacterium]